MAATKRNFILSSGIGLSADNIYTISSTNSTSIGSGAVIVAGGVGIGQSVSIGGRLQMFNSSNYTAFVSSATGNTVYTLPATSPATGTSVLQSTSAGVLSWVPMTATVGASSGNTAQNIVVNSAGNASAFHPILFTPSSLSAGSAVSSDGTISFNPSTEILNVSGLAITATTASTSTANGALQVAGGVGISGRLSFNQASFGTTGIATNPTMAMIGTTGDPIYMSVLEDNSLSFEGSQGQLFSITPNLSTGYIYSVNDITGIPLLRANANANVTANEYAGNFGIGLTNPGYKLHVLGSVGFTSTTASTSTTTGTLVVSGGVGIGGSIFGASTISAADNIEIKSGKELRLNNSGNTFYTGFKAGSNASNTTYTFPAAFPGAGTSVLQSDTSGNLTWTGIVGNATTAQYVHLGNNATSDLIHRLVVSRSSGAGVALSGASTFYVIPSESTLYVSGTVDAELVTALEFNVYSGIASTSPTSGDLRVTGGAGIGGSVSVGGRLQMFNGANYTAFVSSASGNTVYTLPATSPATGSSVLQSTSAGVMSWVPMTAGSSSGNTSQNIVINTAGNANVFHPVLLTPSSLSAGSAVSSDSTITFNPSTEILNVSGLAITSGTASTNTTTGALVVRGGLGVTGQLSFATASFGFTGITTNPTMSFIGATSSSPITLTVLTDNSLNWEGSQGSVFSIDSNLSTGEIFSVSDISGLPIISASAGQTVNINEFGGFTQIGNGSLNSSSSLTGSLVVSGGVGITGNANIGGTVRITNTTATTSSSSGAFTVSGGAGIAQSLFVGGSIVLSNNIYSGGNNFTKAGQAPGDIIFDNNSNDTAGLLYYYKNNTNFGLDVFATGTGSTRFRIVKDLNESGGSELWSIDRNGVVSRTGWDVGEVIATRAYNNTDLNMQSTNTIGITSYVTIATITYTPKSSSSYLWIEFDAHYDFNGGTTVDDYFSRITVGGSTIIEKNQIFLNAPGGGTRSGVLFPISGRYTNSSTSGIAITVQARRGTADDDLRVFGSSTSGYMRIQEIGR